jgi:3-mercaptopyruvate sulfurtransferase SseA
MNKARGDMMNRKIPILVALPLLAILLFVSCSEEKAPTILRISVETVKAKLDAGSNIVIIDNRGQAAYDRDHIAGAISIPLSDMLDANGNALSPEVITQRYSDLQRYDEIITYCN